MSSKIRGSLEIPHPLDRVPKLDYILREPQYQGMPCRKKIPTRGFHCRRIRHISRAAEHSSFENRPRAGTGIFATCERRTGPDSALLALL